MSLPLIIITLVLLSIITIHTISYAMWNWRNKNRMGAIFVFLISLTTIALPVYVVFFHS